MVIYLRYYHIIKCEECQNEEGPIPSRKGSGKIKKRRVATRLQPAFKPYGNPETK